MFFVIFVDEFISQKRNFSCHVELSEVCFWHCVLIVEKDDENAAG